MRKLICILMITTLLLSSLTVFAGGIQPRIDCNHTYGYVAEDVEDVRSSCLTVYYTKYYCKECGRLVEKSAARYVYDHEWSDDILDGAIRCVKCNVAK